MYFILHIVCYRTLTHCILIAHPASSLSAPSPPSYSLIPVDGLMDISFDLIRPALCGSNGWSVCVRQQLCGCALLRVHTHSLLCCHKCVSMQFVCCRCVSASCHCQPLFQRLAHTPFRSHREVDPLLNILKPSSR